MSKYDALGDFLRNQKTDLVPMTFREIEKVIGTRLPASKQYPAWWSNNTGNNVMTKVWLQAGYRSEQVDIAHERLVFRREHSPAAAAPRNSSRKSTIHPAFGALKGTFTIEPSWDLTQPALDPEERQTIEDTLENTGDLIEAGFEGSARR